MSCCNIPLPLSASNISCYSHAEGMQGLTRFVRFDVEQAELHSAVKAIIAYENTGLKQNITFERSILSLGSGENVTFPHRLAEEAGLEWWEPKSITRGYALEYIQFFVVRLWIDEEQHRIYFYESD